MVCLREITAELERAYEAQLENQEGHVASYIPDLAEVNEELFSVALAGTDGSLWTIGDDKIEFTLQSSVKPLLYCIAQALHGTEYVHKHIGHEPSGQRFNAFVLDEDMKPHNPMINAGAIMSSALVLKGRSPTEAFKLVRDYASRAMGHRAPINFANSVYLSEMATCDRNVALTYYMKENSSLLQHDVNIDKVMELYFQCCSLTTNISGLALMAATFSNKGVCPVTNDQVISSLAARNCLALMHGCGMYDYSGRFAFEVGLPAKSGVSGTLMMCAPGDFGMASWSPRLDKFGNSVRSVAIAQQLLDKFPMLNVFEAGHVSKGGDSSPSKKDKPTEQNYTYLLIHAASAGNVDAARELLEQGRVDANAHDYDGRTPLHLAVCEGHEDVVKMLLANGADPDVQDRFGSTPRSDASHHSMLHLFPELSNAVSSLKLEDDAAMQNGNASTQEADL